MSITFPKHYKTPEELVELLSERGLYIQDRDSACQYIKNIGYYRLSAYLYPFLKLPKEKQLFKDGSALEGALMLYRFDKKMRMFLLNEIEKVEIAFRSALANMVAQETGNIFWMTDKESPHPLQHRTASLVEILRQAVVELGGELLAAYDAAVGIRPEAVVVATLTGEVVCQGARV